MCSRVATTIMIILPLENKMMCLEIGTQIMVCIKVHFFGTELSAYHFVITLKLYGQFPSPRVLRLR